MIPKRYVSIRTHSGGLLIYLLSFVAVLSFLLFIRTGFSYAEALSNIIKKVIPSVVQLSTFDKNGNSLSLGSGFFVNNNGDVITNRHVIEGAYSAKIKAANGKLYAVGKILSEDIAGDLIRISVNIPTSIVKPLTISNSNPSVGDRIIIIGSPLGLEQTVSDGIISSIRELAKFGTVIQVTAPISSGSSGSPVVNAKGNVIGVATFQSTKGQNINFATPSSRINKYSTPVNMTLPQWEEAREKQEPAPFSKKYLQINEGFRELPWGIGFDDAQKIYPDLTAHKYKPGQEKRIEILGYKYYRMKDNMELAGVNFNKIEYSFKDNRFYSVLASVNCPPDEDNKCYDLYKTAYINIKSNYGKPSNEIKKEENDIKIVTANWHIGKESIHIDFGKGGIIDPNVTLFISSEKGYRKTIGF